MRRKKKIQKDIQVADGVIIRPERWKQEEKRIYTLLLKAVFVYLIVMGAIGCYLTALQISCSHVVIHIGVLMGAVFCCLLYYNELWENLGYGILLLFLLFVGISLRSYISSGFLMTLNRLSEESAVYFGSKAVKRYAESVGNQYLAVTVSMCYIGWAACVLINVFVSRRMQYVWAVLLSISALFTPLYIQKEPSGFYIIMLLTGLISCFVIRGNGHYHLTRDNTVYEFLPKKKKIQYVYAGRTLAGGMLCCLILCFCLVAVVFTVYPYDTYKAKLKKSELKEQTMGTMENFLLLGIMGMFNRYQSTGGLTSGRLGGVSSIRLDYETDLTLTYVPYANERIYLKNFMGARYLPYANRWEYLRNSDNIIQRTVPIDGTSSFYRSLYDKGDKKAGKGKMEVKNVAAPELGYMPYYSEDVNRIIPPNEIFFYTYYIYQGKSPQMEEEYKNRDHTERWLEVPEQNSESIQRLCDAAGMTPDDSVEELVRKLTIYYMENIPYTYRPGATPYKKDFVNYFLDNNRKGYCAHFATAATLAFRKMGVPARYVEGYAVDPSDLSEEGRVLPEKAYEDYYDGNNIVGNTSVVSVDVTDGDAHAWVEVYVPGSGWKVAEVTPPSGEEEAETMSLMQRLMQLFKNVGMDKNATAQTADEDSDRFFDEEMQRKSLYALGIIIFGAILIFLLFVAGKKGRRLLQYAAADENDRIILKYGAWLKRQQKRYPELTGQINYREQICWIAKKEQRLGEEALEEVIGLLEKAGFSDKKLTKKEQEKIKKYLRNKKE